MGAFVYILRCADANYFAGTTRTSLERRVAGHDEGTFGGYTKRKRPVALVFAQEFDQITDAVAAERQLKGWGRAKKEALIAGDMDQLRLLSRNRTQHPSTSSG